MYQNRKSQSRRFPIAGGSNRKEIPQKERLSGLPNANAKSQRFSYATSQIAPLPPVVALNRSFKSQIAAKYAAFWHAVSQIALTSFLYSTPTSQHFKSQRLQDANATKSQALAFMNRSVLVPLRRARFLLENPRIKSQLPAMEIHAHLQILGVDQPSVHRIAKSGRFANFVREPGFDLNSPTFSGEKPPNSGEKRGFLDALL